MFQLKWYCVTRTIACGIRMFPRSGETSRRESTSHAGSVKDGPAERKARLQGSSEGFEFLDALYRSNGKQVQDFDSFFTYLDRKSREKGIPLCGQFELTPLCNFSCRMCYVHLDAAQLAGRNVLPAQVWKDLMRQAWEAGMMKATLTGGECLAYPGFDELFLYLHGLGCEVSVLTNGFLLDDRRIEFFLQHRPECIQITLYGWNDDVYERVTGQRAFGTVAENARKAIEAGLNVKLTVTPSTYLGDDVLETIRVAAGMTRNFRVNSAIFIPREETGRSLQRDNPDRDLYIRIDRLLKEMRGLPVKEPDGDRLPPAGGPKHTCGECGLQCGGGRSTFTVNWEGTLLACNGLDQIRAYPLKDGFREAWALVNREAERYPRIPECEGCAYQRVCVSCAAVLRQYAEPGKQPLELCETVRYYVRHGVMQIPSCETPSV